MILSYNIDTTLICAVKCDQIFSLEMKSTRVTPICKPRKLITIGTIIIILIIPLTRNWKIQIDEAIAKRNETVHRARASLRANVIKLLSKRNQRDMRAFKI